MNARAYLVIDVLVYDIVMSKVFHRFVRAADVSSHQHWRVANRFDPFGNTQTTLTDPANNRTLTLIGTTNSSTTLAHRTKHLLSELQPDAIYVQACPLWWKYAQHVDVRNPASRLILSKALVSPLLVSPALPSSGKTISEDCFSVPDTTSGSTASKALSVTLLLLRVQQRLQFMESRIGNFFRPQARPTVWS